MPIPRFTGRVISSLFFLYVILKYAVPAVLAPGSTCNCFCYVFIDQDGHLGMWFVRQLVRESISQSSGEIVIKSLLV